MATQLGKTSGKKGLGKSTQPKDIGGVKWAGKKTLLEDADNQNADHSNETTLAAADDHNIAQAADTRQASTGEPADGFQHCASGIKWKRKAKQLLSQAPAGKMKVKKLQKQLLQQSSYPEATWASLGSQLVAQLAASKQFKLTQSSVMLVQ